MRFLGYPISEWSILLGIIGLIGGWLINFLGKRIKRFFNGLLDDFEERVVKPISHSVDGLSDSFEKETTWVHDRHSEVVRQLNKHDKKIENHDDKLIVHDQQIKTLFKNRKGGEN